MDKNKFDHRRSELWEEEVELARKEIRAALNHERETIELAKLALGTGMLYSSLYSTEVHEHIFQRKMEKEAKALEHKSKEVRLLEKK
jgi:hypothetical protein